MGCGPVHGAVHGAGAGYGPVHGAPGVGYGPVHGTPGVGYGPVYGPGAGARLVAGCQKGGDGEVHTGPFGSPHQESTVIPPPASSPAMRLSMAMSEEPFEICSASLRSPLFFPLASISTSGGPPAPRSSEATAASTRAAPHPTAMRTPTEGNLMAPENYEDKMNEWLIPGRRRLARGRIILHEPME